MAKVLLVDTNFSSWPILDSLNRLGHEVHVVGRNPNDCLAKVCPNYWELDYGDSKLLAELVDREGFTYLVPGCTDRSYRSCAEVSNGRFPGIDTAENEQLINNKAKFRKLAIELGLPVPQMQWDDSSKTASGAMPSLNALRFPIIVKPVDGFSGKGVTILGHANDAALQHAVTLARNASTVGLCLIEDYMDGQLYSCTAYVQSGAVTLGAFVEEHGTANSLVVDTSWVLTRQSEVLRQKLHHALEQLSGYLSLNDGAIHCQFICNDDRLWIIEITRRCPGDLYSQLMVLSGHVNYVDCYINAFLELKSAPQINIMSKPILRHTVSVRKEQRFSHLEFNLPINIIRWIPLISTGDYIFKSPQTRVGILFAQAVEDLQFKILCRMSLERNLYRVC